MRGPLGFGENGKKPQGFSDIGILPKRVEKDFVQGRQWRSPI